MCMRSKNGSIANFIQKTWDLLQNQDIRHILRWGDDENTFIIRDRELFCLEILPKYFKHSNFASFVRQLNMYNFHKVRGSRYENEFGHNLFIKQRKELLVGIRRKPSQAELQYGKQLIESYGKGKCLDQIRWNKLDENKQNALIKEQKVVCDKKQDYLKQNEQLKTMNVILLNEYRRSIQINKKNMDKINRFFNTIISQQLKQNFNYQSLYDFLNHLKSNEDALNQQQYEQMITGHLQIKKIPEITKQNFPQKKNKIITNIIIKNPQRTTHL